MTDNSNDTWQPNPPEWSEAERAFIPRSTNLHGGGLSIVKYPVPSQPVDEEDGVLITDGDRAAVYVPYGHFPPKLDDRKLQIADGYTEAGWFGEANIVWLTDGDQRAPYVPYRVLRASMRTLPLGHDDLRPWHNR
jgi:hypothetical protein